MISRTPWSSSTHHFLASSNASARDERSFRLAEPRRATSGSFDSYLPLLHGAAPQFAEGPRNRTDHPTPVAAHATCPESITGIADNDRLF